jgi:sugar phosphate isomerase/epimerase
MEGAMMIEAGPKLGITLYSFTPEYHRLQYTVEGLLEQVAKLGLGPGVEVVGHQSFRGFPYISRDTVTEFRRVMDRLELQPTCLGADIDVAMRTDRLLTDAELIEHTEAQIEAARLLGFPVLRIQYGATPSICEKILSTAERANVKLGMEIHPPHSVDHPLMVELREMCERLKTPYLGFIPDFGSSMVDIPPTLQEYWREQGVPEELANFIVKAWREERDPVAGRVKTTKAVQAMGYDDVIASSVIRSLTIFGRQAPEKWAEIMPYTVHVHAKLFDIDEDGNCPATPYPELIQIFKREGYNGYMSVEYAGFNWAEDSDSFAIIAKFRATLNRLLAEA